MGRSGGDDDLETLWVESGEVRLHVRRSQAGQPGAPILFVHGYPDSWRTWELQLADLGIDHPVAAFDLRGAGRSSPPADPEGFSIPRVLPDFIAVIDALVGPEGQVHLVGHDWGAVLGWSMASSPEHARRLRSYTAIAGPHPDYASALLRARLRRHSLADLRFVADQLRRSWYIFAFQIPGLAEAMLRRDPLGESIRAHRRGGVPASQAASCVDPETIVADTTGMLGLYRQAGRRLADQVRGREVVGPPPPVEVPTLMIVPRRDFALSPLLYDNVGDFVPDLELRYLDANHWVHRELPEAVNRLIRRFVERHEPGA
ncbi:MAG: alpha/beta fold hydrolase [Myxococcales bacterium]|nr:alpha/beta fold hydrolase [Myxococcales bacterium]MCB9702971.1 alpha/beta fold hydrolase [Myxococcales bacterium]